SEPDGSRGYGARPTELSHDRLHQDRRGELQDCDVSDDQSEHRSEHDPPRVSKYFHICLSFFNCKKSGLLSRTFHATLQKTSRMEQQRWSAGIYEMFDAPQEDYVVTAIDH